MKNLYSSALHCNRKDIAPGQLETGGKSLVQLTILLCVVSVLLFTSCRKAALGPAVEEIQASNSHSVIAETNVLNNYTGLAEETLSQLRQARAASARYLNFNNAINDGYVDINVIVPEMGFHYLKAANLDINFDYRKPEILVYNRTHDGKMQLVAVEYAVPISLTPDIAPQGFAGTADVWDKNTGFGLWLLHAWVWAYNPSGVFNPTNPLIHLH